MPARTDRDAEPTTCILWTGAQEPPRALTALLSQRGFRLQTASDRFDAMAAACSAAAAGQRAVLILDGPDRLRGATDLIEAVRGRLPGTVIGTFDERRKPQLDSLDETLANKFANGALSKEAPGGVPLRLVGEPPAAHADNARANPQAGPEPGDAFAGESEPDRHAILSNEELEMLLSDEHDHRRGQRSGPRGQTRGKP